MSWLDCTSHTYVPDQDVVGCSTGALESLSIIYSWLHQSKSVQSHIMTKDKDNCIPKMIAVVNKKMHHYSNTKTDLYLFTYLIRSSLHYM